MNFFSACSRKIETNGESVRVSTHPCPATTINTFNLETQLSLKIHSCSKEGPLEDALPFDSDFLVI